VIFLTRFLAAFIGVILIYLSNPSFYFYFFYAFKVGLNYKIVTNFQKICKNYSGFSLLYLCLKNWGLKGRGSLCTKLLNIRAEGGVLNYNSLFTVGYSLRLIFAGI
jgi:hypothetical protein